MLRLEKIEQHDEFRVASGRAKLLRSDVLSIEPYEVKVIFAEHELMAEDLLSQVREPTLELGDD